MHSRREFLQQVGAASVVTLGAGSSAFWSRALANQKGQRERVLVLVQLGGGNDGLNTVVPYSRDEYYKARPGIAIEKSQVLKLNGDLGLHPAMTGFKQLFDAGQLAVLQGVGYPQPDRSHFRSMDIWQSARPDVLDTRDGWLGRALEKRTQADAAIRLPALAIGTDKLPLALLSQRFSVPTIRDPQQYQLRLPGGPDAEKTLLASVQSNLAAAPSENSDLAFVRATTAAAISSSSELKRIAETYKPAVPYPQHRLAQHLRSVAQMIASDFGPSVYCVAHDGFDTHSQQANAHATLLGELSSGITAFFQDLAGHQLDREVLIVTFSEFGRRVAENGSLGTDHGAASQMFAISSQVRAGLHGALPSLTDLDDGDLKFHTDFRSIYATLLDQWLGVPSAAVLGRQFPTVAFLTDARRKTGAT